MAQRYWQCLSSPSSHSDGQNIFFWLGEKKPSLILPISVAAGSSHVQKCSPVRVNPSQGFKTGLQRASFCLEQLVKAEVSSQIGWWDPCRLFVAEHFAVMFLFAQRDECVLASL